MPYAAEVYFDDASSRSVTRIWERLAEAGVSRSMLKEGYRPHWSFAVSDELDVEALAVDLAAFMRGWRPLTTTLSSIGAFPTSEGAVFYGVTVTDALLDLHREFFRIFEPRAGGAWSYYRPGIWVPHCTLGYGLDPDQVGAAFRIAMEAKLPLDCRTVEVALVDVTAAACQPLRSWRVG